MTKRNLLIIISVLLLTNIFTLIYSKNKNQEDAHLSSELNDFEGNLTKKDVTSSEDFVASFGDEYITYKDWMKSLREVHGKEHLKTMILEKVVDQLAKERNFKVNEKVIEREIAFLTTMSGLMSEDQLAKQQERWKEELYFQHQLEALLTEDIQVSEEEAQVHYESYRNQYDFSATFQISHIVVEDRKTAEKVKRELDQGALFSLLAQEYSIDEQTKNSGGYLGYFTKGSQFVPYGYEEIIENLEEQSYSDPINLGKEYVIVYLHRELPSLKFSFEELKEEISRELALKQIDKEKKLQEIWEEQNIDWIFDS